MTCTAMARGVRRDRVSHLIRGQRIRVALIDFGAGRIRIPTESDWRPVTRVRCQDLAISGCVRARMPAMLSGCAPMKASTAHTAILAEKATRKADLASYGTSCPSGFAAGSCLYPSTALCVTRDHDLKSRRSAGVLDRGREYRRPPLDTSREQGRDHALIKRRINCSDEGSVKSMDEVNARSEPRPHRKPLTYRDVRCIAIGKHARLAGINGAERKTSGRSFHLATRSLASACCILL